VPKESKQAAGLSKGESDIQMIQVESFSGLSEEFARVPESRIGLTFLLQHRRKCESELDEVGSLRSKSLQIE
jgi:hypothetical protein